MNTQYITLWEGNIRNINNWQNWEEWEGEERRVLGLVTWGHAGHPGHHGGHHPSHGHHAAGGKKNTHTHPFRILRLRQLSTLRQTWRFYGRLSQSEWVSQRVWVSECVYVCMYSMWVSEWACIVTPFGAPRTVKYAPQYYGSLSFSYNFQNVLSALQTTRIVLPLSATWMKTHLTWCRI